MTRTNYCADCARLQAELRQARAHLAKVTHDRNEQAAARSGWMDAAAAAKQERDRAVEQLAEAVRERDEARETNRRLNRRCQQAESAARDRVDQHPTGRLGRGLLEFAAREYKRQLSEVARDLAAKDAALREVKDLVNRTAHPPREGLSNLYLDGARAGKTQLALEIAGILEATHHCPRCGQSLTVPGEIHPCRKETP